MDLGGTRLAFDFRRLEQGMFFAGSFDGELVYADFVKPEGEENPDYAKSCLQVVVGTRTGGGGVWWLSGGWLGIEVHKGSIRFAVHLIYEVFCVCSRSVSPLPLPYSVELQEHRQAELRLPHVLLLAQRRLRSSPLHAPCWGSCVPRVTSLPIGCESPTTPTLAWRLIGVSINEDPK